MLGIWACGRRPLLSRDGSLDEVRLTLARETGVPVASGGHAPVPAQRQARPGDQGRLVPLPAQKEGGPRKVDPTPTPVRVKLTMV